MNRQRDKKKSTHGLRLESLESRNLLTTVELLPMHDNSIFGETTSVDDGLSNGSGEYLFIGQIAPRGGSFNRRALIEFDVSEIPTSATINSVSLRMTMSQTISGDFDATLHRATSEWGEGVSDAPGQEGTGVSAALNDATWIHRKFPIDSWNAPGGDFVSDASATTSIGPIAEYTWSSQGMIDDVSFWLQNPNDNFGWMILGNEIISRSAKRFNSREHSDPATRPQLIVDFTEEVIGGDPTVGIEDASNTEGDIGTIFSINFPVTISAAADQDVSVDYTVTSGSATVGDDFENASGTLTFSGGVLTQEIVVAIIGDTAFEGDEDFIVTLSNPVGLEIADGEATGTILDDDTDSASEISIADQSFPEGNVSNVVPISIVLSAASDSDVSVDYAIALGTADENDVEAVAGTVTFAPGETSKSIDVTFLGDLDDEPDETFTIELSNPVNATLGNGSATVQLLNDDGISPWHNAVFPEDVSGDGVVIPFDALMIINEINGQGDFGLGPLPPLSDGVAPPPYLDVTGDNVLSSRDALLVINWLNDQPVAANSAIRVANAAILQAPRPNDLVIASLWGLEFDEDRDKLARFVD